jgi:hypothetical protein
MASFNLINSLLLIFFILVISFNIYTLLKITLVKFSIVSLKPIISMLILLKVNENSIVLSDNSSK